MEGLSFKEYLEGRVSPNTQKTYEYWHKILIKEQGNIPFEQYDLDLFLTKHRNGPARGMLVNLKEYYKENINIPRLKKPRSKKIPDHYTDQQVDQYLEALRKHPKQHLIVRLMAEAGLRISEALNIKFLDINPETCRIKITGKGGVESLLLVAPSIIDRIAEITPKPENEYVFYSRDPRRKGKPLTTANTRYHLTKISKGVHPHAFRHSFATSLLNRGTALVAIQNALRHADISTTARYTHIQNSEAEDAMKKLWRQ